MLLVLRGPQVRSLFGSRLEFPSLSEARCGLAMLLLLSLCGARLVQIDDSATPEAMEVDPPMVTVDMVWILMDSAQGAYVQRGETPSGAVSLEDGADPMNPGRDPRRDGRRRRGRSCSSTRAPAPSAARPSAPAGRPRRIARAPSYTARPRGSPWAASRADRRRGQRCTRRAAGRR